MKKHRTNIETNIATTPVRVAIVMLILLSLSADSATAGMLRPFKQVVSSLFNRGRRETGKQSGTLNKSRAQAGRSHAENATQVSRKQSPITLEIVENSGRSTQDVSRLRAKYGDEALWVIQRPRELAIFYRHGDAAIPAMLKKRTLATALIEKYGLPAAKAMQSLNGQNARRLAMLSRDGNLLAGKQSVPLLNVVSSYGDRAMEFVWHNKGALAVSAVLVAFLAEPEPFLDGARDLTGDLARRAATPLVDSVAQGCKQVAADIARRTNWTLLLLAVIAGVVCLRFHPVRLLGRFIRRTLNLGWSSLRPTRR